MRINFLFIKLTNFERPDFTVATGLAILVETLFASGDTNTAILYAETAKKMFEELKLQHYPLYSHVVLGMALYETKVL